VLSSAKHFLAGATKHFLAGATKHQAIVAQLLAVLLLLMCGWCTPLQVRLVVPGDVDGGMNAGRFPMLLHWEAGLDEAGRLAGLKLDVTCTVRG
jgi:hypothetical protein